MSTARRCAAVLAVVGGVGTGVMLAPGTASAAPIHPFQVQPAAFGNPNGSLDVPPIHCGLTAGRSGSLVVTGTQSGRWGCVPHGQVSWINLSTGATGAARLSGGLNGNPAEATLRTGRGQVAVMLTVGGIVTPGFATTAVR